mmetsp:Transcript_3217/g.13041  ORF Transcript_3217/g.13041 Transcript_3217/m.13041 type:complete len:376 (+) Transcript_3217:329-1456(+)
MKPSVDATSRHGCMSAPTSAVSTPLDANVSARGAALTSAYAGPTTFAAMLVDRVATKRPTSASAGATPPDVPQARAMSCTGSATTPPNRTSEAPVAATPTNESAAIENGRPRACPASCERCECAKRVKSGMLSERVAQKLMLAVSAGQKTPQKPLVAYVAEPAATVFVAASAAPRPPAAVHAHTSNEPTSAMSTGAVRRSIQRMLSTPRTIMATCSAQNAAKPAASATVMPSAATGADSAAAKLEAPVARAAMTPSAPSASPPSQVWMPNHPVATAARRRLGTLAPLMPKAARAATGKGTPYFVPTWPLRTIGTSTTTLAHSTVPTAVSQLIPSCTRLAARMYAGTQTTIPTHSAARSSVPNVRSPASTGRRSSL